jgi:Ca2+-binding RTX toxin-like protein
VGGGGQDTFTVSGAQNISLLGGAGDDTFIFNNGATITGSVGGDGGTDTLDFSRYTTDVTINLVTGVTTGVMGGNGGFENIYGGSGNDQLIGNDKDNILSGGAGNNTLNGGNGMDTALSSGPGDTLISIENALARLAAVVAGIPVEEVIAAWLLPGDTVPLMQTVVTLVVVNHRAAANVPTNWVLFAAASGDSATVLLEPVTSLPYFLPTQYTFISALKVAVMLKGQVMPTLPTGKTLTVSFAIPTLFATRNLAILYWDVTLNNGAGGWVRLNIVIRQREQVTATQGWTTLPMKLFYWNDAAKFGTGDWVEVEVNGQYNAERRALTTVNFVGVFVLIAEP